jgi:hypothetical protein
LKDPTGEHDCAARCGQPQSRSHVAGFIETGQYVYDPTFRAGAGGRRSLLTQDRMTEDEKTSNMVR